jgi:hypothetical protein
MADKFAQMHDFHRTFSVLLHAANLQHGKDGFTFPPKEGVLRIFSPLKIRQLRPGLNPRTWVLKGSTLPLDHRSRLADIHFVKKYVVPSPSECILGLLDPEDEGITVHCTVGSYSPGNMASHFTRLESSATQL